MPETAQSIKPEYIIEVLMKRRWYIIIPFSISLIIGIYLSITLPKEYQSETLILVEPQRVPTSYVQSIVSQDIDARISTLSQQILSRTNLEKIIKEFKLFSEPEYKQMYFEDKLEKLRERISVSVTRARRGADAFSISFKGKEPEKVMRVVNALTSYFIDQNLKVREAQAVGTSDFLEDELGNMRKKLEGTEERLKEYKKEYMGELPEQLETNLRILDRLQEQLEDRQESLRLAKIRLDDIERRNEQGIPVVSGVGDEGGLSELEQLRLQLDHLLSRYTEKHPDVIRLKKRIAEYQEDKKNQAINPDEESTPITEPVSPAVARAEFELKREVVGFNNEITDLRKELDLYQQRVENTPKREQELMSLQRDYSNIQESYSSLLARKLESEIAVNMERKQKGEQFRILDSARLPQKPVSPDMKKLFFLFVIAGLGISGGIIFMFEYLDNSFRSPDEVESVLEVPVLGTIPPILNIKQKRWKRVNIVISASFSIVSFCLLVLFALLTFKGMDPTLDIFRKIISISQGQI
ncbi:MAG: protein GumC [Desulfobacteraceae bacterium]|nr:protein GumC [Desulfobacteraceae bacterium]